MTLERGTAMAVLDALRRGPGFHRPVRVSFVSQDTSICVTQRERARYMHFGMVSSINAAYPSPRSNTKSIYFMSVSII